MSALGILAALLCYVGAAVLVGGVYYRVRRYIRTPVPLPIATTPAPITGAGVALRMLREVVLFESLFKASKWTWLCGWLFHFGLLLVLLRHLRLFTEPVWPWVTWLQSAGKYAAFMMLAGLAGLWIRRLCVDRVRYISALSDHLMLALLVAIGVSGLLMTYYVRTDVVAVKAFVLGVMYLDWQPLPDDAALLSHLALVWLLAVVFPFSKLLHAPGVFLSPTRMQPDHPREHRHAPPPWRARREPPPPGGAG